MRKTRLTILLFLLIATIGMTAQPYCHVRTFNIRDGLAANIISRMAQTDDGLMWFATWNGLCCYDGYRFTTFRGQPDNVDRLTTNRLMMIAPNSRGDIWCATYDRVLFLFDTRQCRFVNIGDMIEQKYGIQFEVRNIYPLKNGHTWISGDKDVLALIRIDDQRATSPEGIELLQLDGKQLKGRFVKKVVEDADGQETVITDEGMTLLDAHKQSHVIGDFMQQVGRRVYYASPQGQLVVLDKQRSTLAPLPMPEGVTAVHCMVKCGEELLLGTNAGIVQLQPTTNKLRLLPVQQPGSMVAVTDLFSDSKGRVWAFCNTDGVALVQLKERTVRWLQTPAPGSLFQQTTSKHTFWHEDGHHTIWLVPHGGTFCYYDEQAASLVPYQLNATGSNYANIPIISKQFIDRQGNAWIGGNFDLTLLNFKYHQFHHVTLVPYKETRAVCYTHDGRLWAGDFENHVVVFDAQMQKQGYLNENGQVQSQETQLAQRVYCLFEDSRQRLWIGTRGAGLYLLDHGRMHHFTHDADNPSSLSDSNVYAIDEDERGNIWIGTYGQGLNLVQEQGGEIRFLHAANRLKNYPLKDFFRIRRITHNGQGVVVLSTTTGMVTFSNRFSRPEEIHFFHSSHVQGDASSLQTSDVLQTVFSSKGKVYVTTLGGGVQELAGGDLLRDSLQFVLGNPYNYNEGNTWSMIEDNQGRFWAARESTINRFDPATRRVEQFGPNDLVDRIEFTEAQPAISPSGDICLATVGGFVTFRPEIIHKDKSSPNIVFTRVQYLGETTPVGLLNTRQLEVNTDHRDLTIHFAALDYSDNYLMQYAYHLEDDKEGRWNYLGNTPSISFSDMPPGEHTLTVKSTNGDGVWVDNEVQLSIYVVPHWWEYLWVQILLLLLAIGIATLAVLSYLKHRQRRQEQEQRLENILRQYRELQEQVAVQAPAVHYHLEELQIVNPDEEMMQQLMAFIEQRISDEGLKVDDMAQAVNMGRTVFYEKMRSLVGMAPLDFLRKLRMQRASQLISRSTMNVSEIAYSVGFTDPKYFSRCFKKETGMSPREYREQNDLTS